jgi:hypothetical protein
MQAAMTDRIDRKDNTKYEEKGLVTDVIVPLAQSAVGGYVGAKVGQSQKPKPEKKE